VYVHRVYDMRTALTLVNMCVCIQCTLADYSIPNITLLLLLLPLLQVLLSLMCRRYHYTAAAAAIAAVAVAAAAVTILSEIPIAY
jgi:hypothetical protein